MKSIIVVDIDGTLANINHRLHYIKKDKPEWDKFYEAAKNDTVNKWCECLISMFSRNRAYEIFLVSGRPAKEKEQTQLWLGKNMLHYDALFLLRGEKDYSSDVELKRKWLQDYRDGILFVVDDRQSVVDMWREEGLVCLQCYQWDEFEKKS